MKTVSLCSLLLSFVFLNGCLSPVKVFGTATATAADKASVSSPTPTPVTTPTPGFTSLHSFNSTDGNHPKGVTLIGSTVYGATQNGGSGDVGILYSMGMDGSNFNIILDLNSTPALYPQAELMYYGGKLYNTQVTGGNWGYGGVFSVNLDGSAFQDVYDFTGDINGANPAGSLLVSGSTIYGTSDGSNTAYCGSIYKVGTDGTGFSNLHSFPCSSSVDGYYPYSGLVLTGGYLYGTTSSGGPNGHGVLFRIQTNGSGYTLIHSFSGAQGTPTANLTLSADSQTFYGICGSGGTNSVGLIYSIGIGGTGFTSLHNFSGSDGWYPGGSLLISGSTLYGTATAGGSTGRGSLFSVATDGTNFTKLHDFIGSDGANPISSLQISGSILYGVTDAGGANSYGTVYQYQL